MITIVTNASKSYNTYQWLLKYLLTLNLKTFYSIFRNGNLLWQRILTYMITYKVHLSWRTSTSKSIFHTSRLSVNVFEPAIHFSISHHVSNSRGLINLLPQLGFPATVAKISKSSELNILQRNQYEWIWGGKLVSFFRQ